MEHGMQAVLTANDLFNLGVATLLFSLAPLLIGSAVLSRRRRGTFLLGVGCGIAGCGLGLVVGYYVMR